MLSKIKTEEIGKFGFGYMRLPRKGGGFDMEQINMMADAFIESGGTYFDAAYIYDGAEVALRESVVKRHPRESVQIATKLPLNPVDSLNDLDELLSTSLERLGTGYVDFYLLHAINAGKSKKLEEIGAWGHLAKLKAKGTFRHLGISFHGPPEELEEILHRRPEVEFAQLQINYYDWNNPEVQARRLYEIARKYGVPIIVMEPMLGGLLASGDSPIAPLLLGADPAASLASWALRFVAQLEGVFVTLSGVSTLEQMADNIATYSELRPITREEQDILDKAVDAINAMPRVACTDCRYCVNDCPERIMIPALIGIYNDYLIHNTTTNLIHGYRWSTSNRGKARDCTACRVCEDICPQSLEIVETLGKLSALLD